MQRTDNEIKLKQFKNLYCDGIACSLGEYIDVLGIDENEILKNLLTDEIENLIEFAVLKNKISGVGKVNIKTPFIGMGVKYLDKYGVKGSEVLSARQMPALLTSQLVGGRIIFDVENLLDYSEGYLGELSDFCGQLNIPIMISLGRDIEEVGILVNRYKMSPVELIESFGFLDRECYLYGLNYIDKDDQKLLATYSPTLLFMPKNDGEEGRGAINLFNFIYNGLSFCFSSGKCYNIDMLGEGKLALTNTTNLMHERGLVSSKEVLSSLEMQDSENEITIAMNEVEKEENIFDKKVSLYDENLIEKYNNLKEKVIQIAKKIKEKI